MKTFLLTFSIIFSFSYFSHAQDDLKSKEIKYEMTINGHKYFGKYSGNVEKIEINEKKKTCPSGVGLFIGKNDEFPDKDVWAVYDGNWMNGSFDGHGFFYLVQTKKETQPISFQEISDLSRNAAKLIEYVDEIYKGNFSQGSAKGLEFEIETKNFIYKGNVDNWLPNGTGKNTLVDTVYFVNKPYLTKQYEGMFVNGEFDQGTITLQTGEVFIGICKNKLFTGKGKLNVEGKYSYEGDWVNGLIQGNGKMIINDTLSIASSSILVKEYEGFFTNGKFEKGIIRSESNGELKGVLKDGEFSGEGKITFQKSLSISLAKNPHEVISYSGKITDSKFDNGQMKLKSGETLTGAWTNNLFSGSAKLNIGNAYSYDGDWFQGEIHGPGKMTKKNEWLYTGSFNKNQIVGSGELMYFIGNTYFSNFQGKLKEDQFDIRLENNEKLRIVDLNDLVLEGSIIDNTFIGFGEVELDNKAVYKGSISMSFDAERIDEKLYSDELEFTTITSGEGRLSYPSGDTLHVKWDKDGYFGTGRVNLGLSENGDSLYQEGNFRNGLLYGQGKKGFMYKLYTYDEQEYFLTYTGQFKDGAMHGKGVLYGMGMVGDVSLDGDWVNNAFTKGTMVEEFIISDEDHTVETYTGEFINNQRNGQGVLKEENGTYIGTFKDGSPHGNGKYIYTDGRIYEGEMKDGVPSGNGKMTLKNKQVLNGKFEDGEYHEPFQCKTATIGTQVWMAENLTVTKFRNGDPIPEARTAEEWLRAGNNKQPAFCYVNNDPNTVSQYGVLYNWYAVNDRRGLAPEGWRIPAHTDVFELRGFTQKHVYELQNKILQMENDGLSSDLINLEQEKLDKYFLTKFCDLGGVRLFSVGQCFEYINNDLDVLKYCGFNKYGFNGKNEAERDSENGVFVLPSPAGHGLSKSGATYWSSSSVGENGFILSIDGRAGPINSYDNYSRYEKHWLKNIDNQSSDPKRGLPIRCVKN